MNWDELKKQIEEKRDDILALRRLESTKCSELHKLSIKLTPLILEYQRAFETAVRPLDGPKTNAIITSSFSQDLNYITYSFDDHYGTGYLKHESVPMDVLFDKFKRVKRWEQSLQARQKYLKDLFKTTQAELEAIEKVLEPTVE